MKYSGVIKILGNVLVAILSPLFGLIVKSPKVFNAMRTGFYREGYSGYPDYKVESFGDIIRFIYPRSETLYQTAIVILFLVLTPFAIYKEHKYEQGKTHSFLTKWLILSIPFCITSLFLFGAYLGGAPSSTAFKTLILLPCGFALYLNVLSYFIVDIWVEKPFKKKTL